MPPPTPEATRDAIKQALAEGRKTREIAADFRISISTACNMKKLWKEIGEVWEPPSGKNGRPEKVSRAHLERLRDFVEAHPESLMRDVALFLEAECGITVDKSTIWRLYDRYGWHEEKAHARERGLLGEWKPILPPAVEEDEESIARSARRRKNKPRGPNAPKRIRTQEPLLKRAHEFVKHYMSQPQYDASHDYSHIMRVLALARHILKAEREANSRTHYDPKVVELAALMHDINDRKYALERPQFSEHISSTNGAEPPRVPGQQSAPFQDASLSSAPFNDLQYPGRSEQSTSYHTPNGAPISTDPNVHPETHPMQLDPPSRPATDLPEAPRYPRTPLPPAGTHTDSSTIYPAPIETHLQRLGAEPNLANAVSTICTAISYSTEIQFPAHIAATLESHPELAIVQDADRLDALGAYGIARTFTYGGARKRGFDDTVSHMQDKLLRLEGMMKTQEGQRLARLRTERITMFRSWMEEEGLGRPEPGVMLKTAAAGTVAAAAGVGVEQPDSYQSEKAAAEDGEMRFELDGAGGSGDPAVMSHGEGGGRSEQQDSPAASASANIVRRRRTGGKGSRGPYGPRVRNRGGRGGLTNGHTGQGHDTTGQEPSNDVRMDHEGTQRSMQEAVMTG